MLQYKIITDCKVYDDRRYSSDDWSEILFEEQENKCKELGIDIRVTNEVKCHFFDSIFFNEQTVYMSVNEAIQCLAIKDGVDLVQYENGNYGFVAYYNNYVNGFEIMKEN